LSELTVQKISPESQMFNLWDERQKGLVLRVQPTGQKAFKVCYSHRGRPRWFHIGDVRSIGLSDARKLAAEIMLRVIKGEDPVADRQAERGRGTFAELALRYREHAKKKNRSWEQAAYLIDRNLIPHLGKLQASGVTRADVRAAIARMASLTVQNQTLAAMSAIYSWAIREEIVSINPCKLIERNATQSRERILSDAEIPIFWEALDDAGLVASLALKTILLTGQRPGEVAHMRLEHIADGGWWEMPGAPDPKLGWPGLKNKSSHRIWLPVPVRASVGELVDDRTTGFVFAGPRSGAITNLDAAMRATCSHLGAERATPHDLRRTHGTMITRLGFGRDIMNRIQNHRDGGIATVYDRHKYADEIKHVMEIVAARIVALAEGKEDAEDNVVKLSA
jgi:integrase